MRISTLATAVAFASIAIIGSVSASDQLTTMKGINAVPMSAAEMNAVKGMDHHFFVITTADNPNALLITLNGVPTYVLDPAVDTDTGPLATDGRFGTDWYQDFIGAGSKGENFVFILFPDGVVREVSPAYLGLMNACGNGTIEGPGFLC